MEYTTSDHKYVFSNHSLDGGATENLSVFMDEVETLMTYKVASIFKQYWFAVLLPIGLIGNTLSFLVMIKPNNRRVSTCIYMAAISVNDNLMMCLALDTWLLTTENMYERNLWGCKSKAYLVSFCTQTSTYLVLTMTIDKYVAIKWPHKAATYSTPTRTIAISLGVIICALCYNIPHLFSSNLIKNLCVGYALGGTITKIYSWISFLVNFIIPLSMLIHMNYAIIKAVKNSQKFIGTNTGINGRKKDQGMDVRQKNMKSAENQLTIMLLLVTVLFLVLLLPAYIRFIYSTFVGRETPAKYAISVLMFEVTHKLYNTNNGINFFLYCISGKRFRNDLKEIVCCIKKSTGLSSSVSTTRSDEQTGSTGFSGSR